MRKSLLLSLTLFMAMFAMAQDPATFEDVQLGSNGIWQPPIGANEMPSGGWLFTNNTQNGYWGGFTASNRTDLSQSGLDAQYTAATGCGYDGSSQYAVAYTMGVQTDVYATDGQLHTVTGCYVTNNLWTYEDMLQGGYGEPPYGGYSGNDPDWFKVTATGKNASGQTVGTLDFYLADFRFANNEEDYVLNTWEWFDLSPLGDVATISFSLSSSRGSGYNMITPAYFCMDNFNGGGTAPDLPPYIVNPVQDVVFNEYPQTIQVNLNGVATDPDDPDENITYSIVSNSNPSALSATMSGKILVMTRQNANQATANLTMRATSDGQYVDFTVHVILNAVIDEPPYIVNPVQDVVFNEYPQTIQVNLNGVATDPDDPDENITYSVVSNSNPVALSATMSNKILVMTRQNANQATADLTMRATSDGQYVDFNVHVILNAVIDEPPYIVNPVQDVLFNEYPQTIQVNLNGVATDPDDPDENITYSIVSNSNPSALNATMSGKILIMTRQNANQATADLTMRATSDGQYVNFNVHVILNAVIDEPPYIVNPVQDVVFNEYPQTIQVNLNGVATDPDDPDENITYSIFSNSNPSALSATMSGKILVMTRQNANQATADLTIRATSDGQHVDFTVHVIINAIIDEPPYIVNPVQDVEFDDFPQTIEINLDGVATDPDDPDENIVYTIVSNPFPEDVSATMNGKILVLTREANNDADFSIVMRATSDGQHVDFEVHVVMYILESVNENHKAMQVYPNPTNGVVTIDFIESQEFEYVVYDLLGQSVLSGQAKNGSAQIDLTSCHQGIYFVTVSYDNNRLIQKVIVR